jgi:hypothetical protein
MDHLTDSDEEIFCEDNEGTQRYDFNAIRLEIEGIDQQFHEDSDDDDDEEDSDEGNVDTWAPTLSVVGQNIYASNPAFNGSSTGEDPVLESVDARVHGDEVAAFTALDSEFLAILRRVRQQTRPEMLIDQLNIRTYPPRRPEDMEEEKDLFERAAQSEIYFCPNGCTVDRCERCGFEEVKQDPANLDRNGNLITRSTVMGSRIMVINVKNHPSRNASANFDVQR